MHAMVHLAPLDPTHASVKIHAVIQLAPLERALAEKTVRASMRLAPLEMGLAMATLHAGKCLAPLERAPATLIVFHVRVRVSTLEMAFVPLTVSALNSAVLLELQIKSMNERTSVNCLLCLYV